VSRRDGLFALLGCKTDVYIAAPPPIDAEQLQTDRQREERARVGESEGKWEGARKRLRGREGESERARERESERARERESERARERPHLIISAVIQGDARAMPSPFQGDHDCSRIIMQSSSLSFWGEERETAQGPSLSSLFLGPRSGRSWLLSIIYDSTTQ
jgi:hypothetical protein